MIHRIFVVPTRPDVPVDTAIDHWEQRHGSIFAATPHLSGYVQHRPSRPDQHRLGGRVCAEAWFTDREDEARAWASDHYVDVVTPDEHRFVDRPRAWVARIVGDEPLLGGPAVAGDVEVVLVGCDPADVAPGTRGRVLDVNLAGPDDGPAHVVLASVADNAAADALVADVTADVSFRSTVGAVLPPPGWPIS